MSVDSIRSSRVSRATVLTALAVVAGAAVALATGPDAGLGVLVVLIAAVYLLAAVVGRPAVAWLGLCGGAALLAVGAALDSQWPMLALLVAVEVVLVVVGSIRGAWRSGSARLQLVGAAAFTVMGTLVALTGSPWAAALAVLGLVGHAAWDLRHHRIRSTVPPTYAAFCVSLDLVLAGIVAAGMAGVAIG